MNTPQLLDAAAQLCNGTGLLLSVLVYKRPNSLGFTYNQNELPAVKASDTKRHRIAIAGFIAIGAGFLLQMAAQLIR